MDSKITIGKRFILTSGALLLVGTAMAVVSILGYNDISKQINTLATDAIPGSAYSAAIRGDVYLVRADALRLIAESDTSQMPELAQQVASDEQEIFRDVKGYDDQIFDPRDRQNFDKLKATIDTIRQAWQKVLPISEAGKSAEAYRAYKLEIVPYTNVLDSELDALTPYNQGVSDAAIASATRTVHACLWLTIIIGIVTIPLAAGLSWWMVSALNMELTRMITELSESAAQIASAAGQVTSSSHTLAQGAAEQAATIEETSSVSIEINSMAQRNTRSARSATEEVVESQRGFDCANRSLHEMEGAMAEIHSSSQKISKIIKVIDEIAFQTNILALNAAVEAARAGEAGMGFAVVADEVRNLAQRCAQAARDTSVLIEESIQSSDGGKAKVDQVANAIRTITAGSEKIKVLVDEINLGSTEQSTGIDQISRAIAQMEQVTQSNAASAEQSAAAAQQLNVQAQHMKDVVIRLQAMVDGNTSDAAYGSSDWLHATA